MGNSLIISWEIVGNTGIISLNNPPQNALDSPDFIDTEQLLEWASNPDVNGIIIKGEGRHFSSGADMEKLFEMARVKEFLFERMEAGKNLLSVVENLEIPVMASIGGACFGGGLEIAIACHLRVCSENALFAFPEVNANLLPGLGGCLRLIDIIGRSKALSLLLSGDTIGAEEALSNKLVDYKIARKQLDEFSLMLMDRLVLGKKKNVVQSIMKAWHNSRKMSYSEALTAETELFCNLAQDELKRQNTA